MAALALAALAPSIGSAEAGELDVAAIRSGIRALAARPTSQTRSLPAALGRAYVPVGYAPLWFTSAGARPELASALAQLAAAPSRGLDPRDYATAWLAGEIRAIADGKADPARVARADVGVTGALLAYLADLHDGRVPPSASAFRIEARDAPFDTVELLRDALARGGIAEAIASAAPPLPAYARLEATLGRYRALAALPWPPLPGPQRGATKVMPGSPYAGADALRGRLRLLGDLDPDAPPAAGERYDATLVVAVQRFQARHGLVEDGVLGRDTKRELDVSPERRVRQIELSLERLRWLSRLRPGPVVAINVPSYRLWAFDAPLAAGASPLAMRVIVGQAAAALRTPIFASAMRAIEFSPYWNVPRSILRNEILPRLGHDPRYLEREEMEIVPVADGAATPTSRVDAATLARLARGELRIRQRPGPRNALGGIKFVLPNAMSIYLHGTPAQELFRRSRRDVSHGCIRVEEPLALARFVLRGRPEWTAERMREAMTAGEPVTVALPEPIPVLIFYTTAIVDGTGRALFLPDVYGYDARLERALRARPPPLASIATVPATR